MNASVVGHLALRYGGRVWLGRERAATYSRCETHFLYLLVVFAVKCCVDIMRTLVVSTDG